MNSVLYLFVKIVPKQNEKANTQFFSIFSFVFQCSCFTVLYTVHQATKSSRHTFEAHVAAGHLLNSRWAPKNSWATSFQDLDAFYALLKLGILMTTLALIRLAARTLLPAAICFVTQIAPTILEVWL